MVLARGTSKEVKSRERIEIFLLLDTHFPGEKGGLCGTQHKKQKCPRKNS
jgi:hypothetical protein